MLNSFIAGLCLMGALVSYMGALVSYKENDMFMFTIQLGFSIVNIIFAYFFSQKD